MPIEIEETELDLIKDFLKENNYISTLECLIKEDNLKRIEKKNLKEKNNEKYPESKLTKCLKQLNERNLQFSKFNETYKSLERKYKSILLSARHIFSVSIECLELLKEIKEGNNKENLEEKIENFKNQIGKYHKIILNDTYDENTKIINEAIMIEHKNILKKAKEEKNNDKIIEILLSLRVYALNIQPELRRNLIEELINNDILNIKENNSDQFVLELLNIHSYNMKHAILSLISIISSTSKGVEYINLNSSLILEKIIEIIKGTEDGQVIQRFCISILQKNSIKENNIKIYFKCGLIDWLIKLLQRSKENEVHLFCLDYSTALIANILQSKFILDFLEKNNVVCKNLMETFLNMLKDKITNSVLMNLLVCLKYLGKDKFKNVKDECKFNERIKDFIDYYSKIPTNTEYEKFDKSTILDLSDSLFYIKDEKKEINYEEKFIKFEKQQKEIIFECFQDEIN